MTSTEQALRDAMQRLLSGRPRYTDGRLIKNNLYREAQVSRATMNRAKNILAEWDTHVAERTNNQPTAEASSLARDLRRQLAKVTQRANSLQQRLDAAATVIGLLHADNTALRERLATRDTSVISLDRARATCE
jgi:hypothetical protein